MKSVFKIVNNLTRKKKMSKRQDHGTGKERQLTSIHTKTSDLNSVRDKSINFLLSYHFNLLC